MEVFQTVKSDCGVCEIASTNARRKLCLSTLEHLQTRPAQLKIRQCLQLDAFRPPKRHAAQPYHGILICWNKITHSGANGQFQ